MEKNIFPLAFKSLGCSPFSKLVNKDIPKFSLDDADIKLWLNLIQGILRCETKDRPLLFVFKNIL